MKLLIVLFDILKKTFDYVINAPAFSDNTDAAYIGKLGEYAVAKFLQEHHKIEFANDSKKLTLIEYILGDVMKLGDDGIDLVTSSGKIMQVKTGMPYIETDDDGHRHLYRSRSLFLALPKHQYEKDTLKYIYAKNEKDINVFVFCKFHEDRNGEHVYEIVGFIPQEETLSKIRNDEDVPDKIRHCYCIHEDDLRPIDEIMNFL